MVVAVIEKYSYGFARLGCLEIFKYLRGQILQKVALLLIRHTEENFGLVVSTLAQPCYNLFYKQRMEAVLKYFAISVHQKYFNQMSFY